MSASFQRAGIFPDDTPDERPGWDARPLTPAGFDTIDTAVAEIAVGRAVVVVDDADPENPGELIFAADAATPELVGFTVRWTSGVLCVALPGDACDRLGLPPMLRLTEEVTSSAFTVSVDAAPRDVDGRPATSGVSAVDRARTIRVLADPDSTTASFRRPGHVFPLRAREGGVLVRPGHTEAAVDLAVLADRPAAGVLAQVVTDDGAIARLDDLRRFSRRHHLPLVTIADLIAHRRRSETQVRHVATARMPLPQGEFRAVGYVSTVTGRELIALVHGEIGDGEDVLVRVHSECLTGDALASLRCDCGPQLQAALHAVATEGRGVVLYIRGHEGRGIGLLEKLRAYELQDAGADTVDANLALGLPSDSREYGTGAQVLADLGIHSMRLLTNNPAKRAGLEGYGLRVLGRVALPIAANPENVRYLTTKRDRMGHELDGLGHA